MNFEQVDVLQDYVSALSFPLSSERLQSYRPAGSTELDMVTTYFWNIALCEALYPVLNAVEVGLRNSIHSTMSHHYATEDWFNRPTTLEPGQHATVQVAKENLRSRGKPDNAGRVVAQLSFGFWVTILSAPYEARVWRLHGYAPLRAAFPHVPRKQRKRWLLQKRFRSINTLRNRVFHYEPIWHRHQLAQEHADILEAIGWITPDLQQSIMLIDRFQSVLTHGRGDVEARIRSHLHLP